MDLPGSLGLKLVDLGSERINKPESIRQYLNEKSLREAELFNLEKVKGIITAILHDLLIEKTEPSSSYRCTAKA